MAQANAVSQSWDQASLQDLLRTNDKAICRALLQIYKRQTTFEQANRCASKSNGVGFSAADAPLLSILARRVHNRVPLSPGEIQEARRRLMKYTRQLLEIIVDRQLQTMQVQQ